MAKHDEPKKGEKEEKTHAAEEAKAAWQAKKDAGKPADGVAVYPPVPTDQSGESASPIPPQKRLPAEAPDAGPDELTRLRLENAALANVVRNLGGNPAEVVKVATAGLDTEGKPKAKVKTRKARVTPEGGSAVDVEYPADTPEPDRKAAATDAWKAQAGVWSPGSPPQVELDPKD